MRGRVIYTDTIVSVWLRLAKNNGLDEEVYGMIVNGGDDGDVSRHSSPSFGICGGFLGVLCFWGFCDNIVA